MTFIGATIYFFKESRSYIGPFRLKDYLYYPVAYVRFMYLTFRVR